MEDTTSVMDAEYGDGGCFCRCLLLVRKLQTGRLDAWTDETYADMLGRLRMALARVRREPLAEAVVG